MIKPSNAKEEILECKDCQNNNWNRCMKNHALPIRMSYKDPCINFKLKGTRLGDGYWCKLRKELLELRDVK